MNNARSNYRLSRCDPTAPNVYTNDITLGSAATNLNPTAASPLIIRGGIDSRTTLSGHIAITNLNHVRLQGFHLTNTNAPSGVLFDGVEGSALAACVVRTSVLFTNSTSAQIIGNTFDGTNATGGLVLSVSTNTLLRNNIYLNDGSNTTAGVEWDAVTLVDSDFNCYYPSNSLAPVETNSLYVAPGLTADGTYRLANGLSPVREAGEPQVAYNADVRGWYRHLTVPSIGAVEYGFEGMERDSGGRITRRWVAGRLYEYTYDARGQLVSYRDNANPANDADYAYDVYGNRILMTVGVGTDSAVTTRFVYQGQDVVAEYETVPGGSSIARKRIYWLLPELDQRIGFVEITGSTRRVYYYLTDQVGTVQRIVDASGATVNQYDYDAFGNIRWENSYEEIPNRYTFQGREWDAHAGHYHYRMRTYIPEWGCFTGPDMNLALGILGEPNGIGNYLFCNNNPLIYTDPLGLYSMGGHYYTVLVVALAGGYSVDEAKELAFFAQYPDYVKEYEAWTWGSSDLSVPRIGLHKSKETVGMGKSLSTDALLIQSVGHSFLDTDPVPLRQQYAANWASLGGLHEKGMALHFYGDLYAHAYNLPGGGERLFKEGMGHASRGSDPDYIGRDHAKYEQYVRGMYAMIKKEGAPDRSAMIDGLIRLTSNFSQPNTHRTYYTYDESQRRLVPNRTRYLDGQLENASMRAIAQRFLPPGASLPDFNPNKPLPFEEVRKGTAEHYGIRNHDHLLQQGDYIRLLRTVEGWAR